MWPPWDEQRIARELKAFLHGRKEWPRHREFIEAGHKQLYGAVLRNGGTHKWARRMGVKKVKRNGGLPRRSRVTRKSKKSGSTRRLWDDERIETAIAPLVKELGRWPTKGEFRRAGLGAALSAVYDHGGSRRWRKRLGVGPSPFTGRVPNRTRWTPQRIESELREFCRGRTSWPEQREFRANGAHTPYSAVCRHGGTKAWRKRLGLQ
jgi:hypothetical protein